jgi:molybdate transport system permease protein
MGINNVDLLPFYVSLKLATVTTGVLVVLAAPVAYAMAYSRFRGKALLEALVTLPMVLPPTVLGYFLIIFMGPKGMVGQVWESVFGESLLFTFSGIAIASMMYSIPFAVQPLKASFSKIDRRLLENAYVLGASRFKTFFRVIVPNSIGGIAAAVILVFLHTLGAFGVLLMIGGSIPGETKVASIAIFEAVETMNYREAGIMALSFLPISYVFLLLMNRFNREE